MDVGTVSSEDVMASYQRQLSDAHQRIALLEAAILRDQRQRGTQAPAQPVPEDIGEVAQ